MRISVEVELDLQAPVTQRSVVDTLESRYPVPSGTIRDHVTQARWPFLRFFACGEDLSHEQPDAPLPDAFVSRNRTPPHRRRNRGRMNFEVLTA
jgi:hypothetical protein